MKRTDVEDLVRQMSWPEPPAGLRARVLSDASHAERSISGAARVAGAQDPARQGRIPIPDDTARSWHGWRRAAVFGAIGTLLMIGSCTSFDVWADRRVEAEIARLEARYGSLDVKVPAVPPADNRAAMVRAAAALAVRMAEPRHRYIPLRGPSPMPTEFRAFADANRTAIRLAGDIRTRRESNWNNPNQDAWPPFDAIRVLSDAIYVTSRFSIEAGRPDEAASLIVSGLGVSSSMRQEPDFVSLSHRCDVARRQLEAVHQLLTASAPSKGALRELAWWLAENRMPDGIRPMLLTEIESGNAKFERMEHGDFDSGIAANIYPPTWPGAAPRQSRDTSEWPSAFLGVAARIGRPFVRTARVRYLQHMERLLDAETGPRPRQAVPRPPARPRWALIDLLTEKFTDGTAYFSNAGDDFTSELSAAEIAVALRRFKLDHRVYPDDLSALAPVYLARLPIDPYTGQPAAYAREGDGFTLRAKALWPGWDQYRLLNWDLPK